MTISKDTARFLLGLLSQQQLNVGAPDFESATQAVLTAQRELLAIIGSEKPGEPAPAPNANRAQRRAAARK